MPGAAVGHDTDFASLWKFDDGLGIWYRAGLGNGIRSCDDRSAINRDLLAIGFDCEEGEHCQADEQTAAGDEKDAPGSQSSDKQCGGKTQ